MFSYIFLYLKTNMFCLIVINIVLMHVPSLHLNSLQQRNKSPITYIITFWNSERYSCLSSGRRCFCIPLLSLPIQSFFILVNLSLLSCLKKNLRLGVTHQLLVYCSDVNILGENIHTIMKNAGVLLYANNVDRLDVNTQNYLQRLSL